MTKGAAELDGPAAQRTGRAPQDFAPGVEVITTCDAPAAHQRGRDGVIKSIRDGSAFVLLDGVGVWFSLEHLRIVALRPSKAINTARERWLTTPLGSMGRLNIQVEQYEELRALACKALGIEFVLCTEGVTPEDDSLMLRMQPVFNEWDARARDRVSEGGTNMRATGEKPDPVGPLGMAGTRSDEPNHEGAASDDGHTAESTPSGVPSVKVAQGPGSRSGSHNAGSSEGHFYSEHVLGVAPDGTPTPELLRPELRASTDTPCNTARVPKHPHDPPFDGTACPMCPRELRNLHAVAHNTVSAWRTGRHHKMAERLEALEEAVKLAQPYADAHFADRMHSHGEKNR